MDRMGSDIHVPKDDMERVEEVIKLQEKTDIRCSSHGIYFTMGDDELDDRNGYFAVAKKLTTNIVRFWFDSKPSADYTSDTLEQFYAICKQAAKMAEDANMILCEECHSSTLTDKRQGALSLMETVNSPVFRMYWQPDQYQSIEENIKNASLLVPYVPHIHVFPVEEGGKISPGNWYCRLEGLFELH